MKPTVKGRFAPSPSGRMHLGNIYAALMSWLDARGASGSWVLRIEDLDPQRSRMEYARLIEDDLLWLGLDWDEGGVDGRGDAGPYLQSLRHDLYAAALERLEATGLTYPCYCTRADLRASSAPHLSDGQPVYPSTCRPPRLGGSLTTPPEGRKGAIRIAVPDREIRFTDRIRGEVTSNLLHDSGDFVLRRADGAWAYQLAVVVDDAAMGITSVVRGDDLLLSTPRQLYLYKLLGLSAPSFAHLPLLTNDRGERLSKRDGALAMDALRRDFTPARLLGELASRAGIIKSPQTVTPQDLLDIWKENPLFNPPIRFS